ncbi:hypothetical protein [Celeribacter arenosi]|uniref:Lipoprotein n=1 Tax=Celeribacter arenosi TaxID=792649 RepID=A0ABP7KBL5_9RHOB
MKIYVITAVALATLSGCMEPTPATPIASRAGKNVYSTTCEVHQGTLGRKAIYGPNKGQIITPANACTQIAATCPAGAVVYSVDQGYPQMRSVTTQNGLYRSTQRYMIRETTVDYSCKG